MKNTHPHTFWLESWRLLEVQHHALRAPTVRQMAVISTLTQYNYQFQTKRSHIKERSVSLITQEISKSINSKKEQLIEMTPTFTLLLEIVPVIYYSQIIPSF